MATTYYTDIQKLYVAYFNRPADPAGLAYWETVVEGAKGSTAAVSAAFAASAEYKAAYAGMSNADIVNTVYMNLFGRAAEDAGKAYWAGLLDSKKITIDAVVTQIAAGAQGSDLVAYNDKVLASTQFTAAVDTDAEKAGYSGDAANKVAKAFLSSITDANSLAAATTPTALNGAVASTVAAGTPFSVAGALAQINTATKALNAYVKSVDVDGDSTTVTTAADITGAKTTATGKVAGDLTGGASGTSGTLFTTTTSQTVRDALITAQQAANADKLANDQKTVADDNTAISKVGGLSNAVTALSAATAALKSAQTAQTAADADLAAKKAAFPVNNTGAVISTTAITVGTTTVADIANGKATLHDGIDATKYAGLTDLIASYNADLTAHNSVATAQSTANFAQLAVNMLDVAADSAGNVTGTSYTESALIAAIAAQINTTTAATAPAGSAPAVAAGATPTVAQIQTELAILQQTAPSTYATFKALVDAEIAGGSVQQTAATALATAKSALTAAQTTLSNDTTAATNAHSALVTAETAFEGGSNVTVSGTTLVFTANGASSATTLANIDGTGHAAVATGITETSNPGVTALITKFNADVDAAATVSADNTAVTNAQTAVNNAQTAANTAGVPANGVVASMNPLTTKLTADTAVVTADTKAISTLAKDVAALQTATANAATLAGYQKAVDVYTQALTDKGYVVTTLDAAHTAAVGTANFATVNSDIYVVTNQNASIATFGLQGNDALSVGSGYTLVQGAIGAKGVTASDSALEIFVSNDTNGNAVLQIEQHAYSSSVTGSNTGEIVTITLTGVDATTLHLNNGIITAGTTTA